MQNSLEQCYAVWVDVDNINMQFCNISILQEQGWKEVAYTRCRLKNMKNLRVRIVRQILYNRIANVLSSIICRCLCSCAVGIFSYLGQTHEAHLLVFLDIFKKSFDVCQIVFLNDFISLLLCQLFFCCLFFYLMGNLLKYDSGDCFT